MRSTSSNFRRVLSTIAMLVVIGNGSAAQQAVPSHTNRPVEQRRTKIAEPQRAGAIARVNLATAILDGLEAEARARGLRAGWRQSRLESLLRLSWSALRRVEQQSPTLDTFVDTVQAAADDPSLLGDTDADLLYTPITPCRFIDTRNVAAGKINGVRTFNVDIAGSNYGGAAACHPSTIFGQTGLGIGALAMNVTLVDTSTAGAPGFVAAKPNPDSPPTSLLNWYEQGVAVQMANQGVVPLANNSEDEFAIQTSGPVHIIVDIFGAFIEPEATAVDTVHMRATLHSTSTFPATVQSPPCPVGYTLTGGGCDTPETFNPLFVSYPGAGDNRWACVSSKAPLSAFAICSRTGGR